MTKLMSFSPQQNNTNPLIPRIENGFATIETAHLNALGLPAFWIKGLQYPINNQSKISFTVYSIVGKNNKTYIELGVSCETKAFYKPTSKNKNTNKSIELYSEDLFSTSFFNGQNNDLKMKEIENSLYINPTDLSFIGLINIPEKYIGKEITEERLFYEIVP